jgi:hypothetical protein
MSNVSIKNLQPGDSLFFEEHLALGLLLEKFKTPNGDTQWSYALRSPTRSNLKNFRVTVKTVCEDKILNHIREGNLIHYAGR